MIDDKDIARLREIFVPRDECNRSMDAVSDKLSKDYTEFAVIKTQLKMIIWVLTAVGGGIITMLIKMFMGGM